MSRVDDDVQTLVDNEMNYIRGLFRMKFADAYGDLSFNVGSALEGTGMPESFGSIIKRCGLEHTFPDLREKRPGLF